MPMTVPDVAADLDDAIRAAAAAHVDPSGEVVVGWLVVCATRGHAGGGTVIQMPSDGAMPVWQARGILAEALEDLRRMGDADWRYTEEHGDDGAPDQ